MVYEAFNFLSKTNQVSFFYIQWPHSIYDKTKSIVKKRGNPYRSIPTIKVRDCSFFIINNHREDFEENIVGSQLLPFALFWNSVEHSVNDSKKDSDQVILVIPLEICLVGILLLQSLRVQWLRGQQVSDNGLYTFKKTYLNK